MLAQHLGEVEEVRWVIRECLDALRTWDQATLTRIFAADSAAIHFGTAAPETYVGSAAYLRAMEEQHTLTIPDMEFEFLPGSPEIQARAGIAWVVGEARVSGTMPNRRYFQFNTRISFVLEKIAEDWKIVHSHYSIGVATP